MRTVMVLPSKSRFWPKPPTSFSCRLDLSRLQFLDQRLQSFGPQADLQAARFDRDRPAPPAAARSVPARPGTALPTTARPRNQGASESPAAAGAFLREALWETPERTVVPAEPVPTCTDPVAVASLIGSLLATLRARAGSGDRVQLCAGRFRRGHGRPEQDKVGPEQTRSPVKATTKQWPGRSA